MIPFSNQQNETLWVHAGNHLTISYILFHFLFAVTPEKKKKWGMSIQEIWLVVISDLKEW